MYLAQVEIQNYRCIKKLTVELQQGLNVLVGRNNVGKTSFLSAIRHALGSASMRGENLWLTEDDFHREAIGKARATDISIVLTFRGLTEAERTFFYEIVEFDYADLLQSSAIIRFSATWNEAKRRAQTRRTGGSGGASSGEVPSELLSALTVTFLPAMRNAEDHLSPGSKSRLAQMLRDISRRRGGNSEVNIEDIFKNANRSLEQNELIIEARDSLQKTTLALAGSDYAEPAIRTSELNFDRILRTLQVQVPGARIEGLHANGLGYNNLLYMAVVLEHLRLPLEDECPMLMVEEPEAHLHPQLTELLAEYLSTTNPGGMAPQTIVSTHSPTLAAKVSTNRIILFFTDPSTKEVCANALINAGLNDKEIGALRRMMDVTRASIYFAKGVVLVEGICEALLIPIFAKRLDFDLVSQHVSVIPICGVAFGTFKKLLDKKALGIPASIITDADPPLSSGANVTWQQITPIEINGVFELSERTAKLIEEFKLHETVKVFNSDVTLEFDLAEAGDANATHIAEAWAKCFSGTPRTLTVDMVQKSGMSRREKALIVWRGVCQAQSTGSKAELAQHLTDMLADKSDYQDFHVPEYIKRAIEHVWVTSGPNCEILAETANANSNA